MGEREPYYPEDIEEKKADKGPQVEKQDAHETQRQERIKLVQSKIRAARNLSRDYLNSIPEKNYGRVVNLHLIGKLLAHSLYSPGQPSELDEYMESHPESMEDFEILNTQLPQLRLVDDKFKPANNKNQDVNIEKFAEEFGRIASKHNLPKRPEYEGKTYAEVVHFEGAMDKIKGLLSLGPVEVWTAGDTHGLPDEDLKGNNEQYKRAISGGLHELKQKHKDKKYELKVRAAENKFGLLKSIATNFEQTGVRQYVVIDDKIPNLEGAKQNLIQLGIPEEDILLIWDRQGSGAPGSDKKMPEGTTSEQIKEMEKKYHAIFDIKRLTFTVLDNTPLRNLDNPIGTIIDHDDVISNTQKAGQIVEENIIDWLEKEKQII